VILFTPHFINKKGFERREVLKKKKRDGCTSRGKDWIERLKNSKWVQPSDLHHLKRSVQWRLYLLSSEKERTEGETDRRRDKKEFYNLWAKTRKVDYSVAPTEKVQKETTNDS